MIRESIFRDLRLHDKRLMWGSMMEGGMCCAMFFRRVDFFAASIGVAEAVASKSTLMGFLQTCLEWL